MRSSSTHKGIEPAEAVKALLIDRYQLRDVGETLSSTPAFFAQLSDKERQAVAASELVSHIDTFNASEEALLHKPCPPNC